ncbi:MAG: sugar transferase [Candidatus Woesearchaeota archaeon]
MKTIKSKIKERFTDFFYGKKPFYFLLLYFSDVFSFVISFIITFYLTSKDQTVFDFFLRLVFFMLLILIMNYSAFNLYGEKRNLFDDNEFMSLLYSHIITFFVSVSLIILFNLGDLLFIVVIGFIVSVFLTTLFRYLLSRVILHFRRRGYDTRNVFFYGKDLDELIKKIEENPGLGYKIIGFTDDIAELKKNLDEVDVVFVNVDNLNEELMKLIIENMSIHWKIIPSAFNVIMDKINFDEFKDYPIINVSGIDPKYNNYLFLKRIIDIVLSGIALILLSPLFLIIAIMIKLTMPGPIFYMQERLGKNLKPFKLIKFRSMVVNADKLKPKLKNEVEGLFKMKHDPRVTWFGNILRRTCLDELPQLINIFKGDMSIVGPRPHLESELKFFSGWRRARFQVQPGLTGLWQVNGRHEVNFDKAVMYDIYYIKHMSLLLDIQIILKTIPSIIFSRGRY